MRLFVGIAVEGAARDALGAFLAQARQAAPHVRWEEPKALHITLQFIGAWPETREGEVLAALGGCERTPLILKVRGLGAFPSPQRPRVIWAGVVQLPELEALAGRVAKQLAPLGIEREARPFSRHVSLGRVGASGDARQLRAQFDELRPVWGEVQTRGFCLYQTVPGAPRAARYEVRRRFD